MGILRRYRGKLLTLDITGEETNVVLEDALPKRDKFVDDFTSLSQDEVTGRFVIEAAAGTNLNRKLFAHETDYR